MFEVPSVLAERERDVSGHRDGIEELNPLDYIFSRSPSGAQSTFRMAN